MYFFFFQAEDGIRDYKVTGVQTCALPICPLQFLSVKARKHEKLTALLVELEGALDRFNAAELKKKLADAASQAKLDIIVNFEHLRHVTPQALQTLLDGEFFKQAAPSVRVRFRKLRAAFDSALVHVSFHGLDLLEEDLQDA